MVLAIIPPVPLKARYHSAPGGRAKRLRLVSPPQQGDLMTLFGEFFGLYFAQWFWLGG